MTKKPNKAPSSPDFTPVPLKYYRHDGWTPDRQRAFIEALARCGSVPNAARSVGMGSARIYDLRNKPGAEEFSAAWEDALAKATNRVHDVLVDHAVNGAPEPIMYGGEQVGEFRRYNYRLMMWLLSLKKQWRAEWEAECQQEGKAMLAEFKKTSAENARKSTAQFEARIEQLRKRMVAAYINKDPATGEPRYHFDPARASPMELMVYNAVRAGSEGDGADEEGGVMGDGDR